MTAHASTAPAPPALRTSPLHMEPGPRAAARASALERFTYDDAIVRKFLLATLVWGFVAMLVGFIAAIELVAPRAAAWEIAGVHPLSWLSVLSTTPWLAFGR